VAFLWHSLSLLFVFCEFCSLGIKEESILWRPINLYREAGGNSWNGGGDLLSSVRLVVGSVGGGSRLVAILLIVRGRRRRVVLLIRSGLRVSDRVQHRRAARRSRSLQEYVSRRGIVVAVVVVGGSLGVLRLAAVVRRLAIHVSGVGGERLVVPSRGIGRIVLLVVGRRRGIVLLVVGRRGGIVVLSVVRR
ncbi:hypothetical protein PMAYCL1PPCAC_11889, partial [Pristionchus mayeri]